MEINRQNFDGVFPKVQHLLQTCEFYAVDLEMTGINPVRNGRRIDPNEVNLEALPHQCRFYSTPEQSFPSKVEASTTFSPMQLGLSIFHKRPANASIDAQRDRLTCKESIGVLDAWTANGKNVETAVDEISKMREAVYDSVTAPSATPPETTLDLNVIQQTSLLTTLMEELDMVEDFITKHRPDSKMEEYIASTFHCHLFPSYHYGDGELKMSIETTGQFLAEHNMDFNAWVRKSLFYAPREELAKKRLEAFRKKSFGKASGGGGGPFNQELLSRVPARDQNTVATVMAEMDKFAEENSDNPDAVLVKGAPYLGDENSFKAVCAKAKSLNLKIQQGNIMWDSSSASSSSSNNGNSATTPHQGTLLIEALFNCRKPVVMHNCWSDLLFLYHAVHSTKLTTYAQFKTSMRQLFPVLYDTRTLCSLDIMQKFGAVRGALDKTYANFNKAKEASRTRITLSDGFVEGAAAAHNAGYDAFQTGSLFIHARREILDPVVERRSKISLEALRGVIPVYASIFSISLTQDYDVLVQPVGCPVFVAYPDPASRGPGFPDKVSALLSRSDLQAVVMNCGDCALAFVTREAKGTGSLLESSKANAQKNVVKNLGARARLIDMEAEAYMARPEHRTPMRLLDIHAAKA